MKGLTFVPTLDRKKDHHLQLQLDLQTYHPKIKLADYFKNSIPTIKKPFMGTSVWSPSLTEIAPEIKNLIEDDPKIFKHHYDSDNETCNVNRRNSCTE